MNIQHSLVENLPDCVGEYIAQTDEGKALPDQAGEWLCHWAYTDHSDMEVTGFCAVGTDNGSLWVVAEALDFPTLTACVAASSAGLTSSTLPLVTSRHTLEVLDWLALHSKDHDGNDDSGTDDQRLHDAAHGVRSVLLAGDEEGEKT